MARRIRKDKDFKGLLQPKVKRKRNTATNWVINRSRHEFLPFATHCIIGDIKSAWRPNGLLQVSHDLAGHPIPVDRVQDWGAGWVGDVGANATQAVRGGARVAFGGSEIVDLNI